MTMFGMTRAEGFCLACGVALLVGIVELIRKRRLKEEYALLWIAAAVSVIGMSMTRTLLHRVAQLVGVYYPPTVLALIAGFFGLVLAIHYSLVISRLSGENRLLAQDVALLKLEVEELRRHVPRQP